MVYSTSRCPHCKNIVRKQTNPVKEIGNPFEKCPYCGQFYKNSYKEEWITKSPLKRFLFFISNGCLARAFVIPLILVGLCSAGGAVNPGLLAGFYFLGFISWLIAGYFIHKNSNESKIKESLKKEKATTIIISHNLLNVKHADKILVLEEGRISDIGTHNELIKRDGYYSNVWNIQQMIEEVQE